MTVCEKETDLERKEVLLPGSYFLRRFSHGFFTAIHFTPTPVSHSLRFCIPASPPDISPEHLAFFFKAIHDVVTVEFVCSLDVKWVMRRRKRNDPYGYESLFVYTVGLEGDVNPLALIRSIERVEDAFVESITRDERTKA